MEKRQEAPMRNAKLRLEGEVGEARIMSPPSPREMGRILRQIAEIEKGTVRLRLYQGSIKALLRLY
jgi:hypothetical protein